jgi:hypothetical protein
MQHVDMRRSWALQKGTKGTTLQVESIQEDQRHSGPFKGETAVIGGNYVVQT